MQFLIDIIVAILTAYLAFTNSLATYIETLLPQRESESTIEESTDSQTLRSLPSLFTSRIPDILLRSAEYQQASVAESMPSPQTFTTDPIAALVNIFCTFKTREYIRTTTGTGFFIDERGVILTNAHIAQFLLLENTDTFGEARCVIRTGSPARQQYLADLLYISPAWIQENASSISAETPMGTGERDYALLYISNTIDDFPLPSTFPALSFNSDLLPVSVRNQAVIAAGYPATDLLRSGPSTALLARTATTSISELYTFGSNFADLFSIRGSVVGAQGASGGPVLNRSGAVIGMITTRGDDEIDGQGSLRAITLSHIDRTIREETGFSLSQNIQGDIDYRAEIFAQTLTPFLVTMLEQAR